MSCMYCGGEHSSMACEEKFDEAASRIQPALRKPATCPRHPLHSVGPAGCPLCLASLVRDGVPSFSQNSTGEKGGRPDGWLSEWRYAARGDGTPGPWMYDGLYRTEEEVVHLPRNRRNGDIEHRWCPLYRRGESV